MRNFLLSTLLGIDNIIFDEFIKDIIPQHISKTFIEREKYKISWIKFIERMKKLNKINYDGLSINNKISIDYLKKHINLPWDYWRLSLNPSLNMDFIERHLDLPWDWEDISGNPSLTMDFVERHIELDWNWYYMSYNKSLIMDFIERYSNFNWDSFFIFGNENLILSQYDKN